MDGKSAFSDEVQNRDEMRILIRNTFDVLRIPTDDFTRERRAIIDRNQRLFGSGADGPGRLYEIGPHPELIGQPASAAGEELDVDLSYKPDYGDVGSDPTYTPVHVVGKVNGPDRQPRDIAVAVNGTIREVAPSRSRWAPLRACVRAGAGVGPPPGPNPGAGLSPALARGLEVREAALGHLEHVLGLRGAFGSGSTYSRALPICSAPSPSPWNWAASAAAAVR